MMKTTLTTAIFVLSAFVTNAYADTATCPPISSVQQTAMPAGGYSYSAPGPGGNTWVGENEEAEASYLAASQFSDAHFKLETEAVICSYEGPGKAGIRLVLKPIKHFGAAQGTNWTYVTILVKDDGANCKASDVSACSFEYN